MNRIALSAFLGLACAGAIVSAPSCAAAPGITKLIVDEVSCVEAQVAAGTDTFEDIAAACAPAAVPDVVVIVTELAAQASTPDAGDIAMLSVRLQAVHHKLIMKVPQ